MRHRLPSLETDGNTPSERHGRQGTFSALRYRNFRLLWTSTLFVSGGNWVQQVTLGWLAFELSGSALSVSIVLGLRAIPLLMAPVAGVLADRFDRRRVMILDQVFLATLALLFAADILLDHVALWHLYVFSFVSGVGWSINNPVRQTLVSNSVPRESLMNAVALNSMAFNTTRIFGPVAGGFLITFFGPGWNFMIQALFYVGVVVMILPYRAEYAEEDQRHRGSPFSSFREGIGYVFHDRTTLSVILVALIPTLTMMSTMVTLMPVFAVDVLGQVKGEGDTLGLLLMGMGIGGFLGTLAMARYSDIRAKGRLILLALATAGIGILVLSQVNALAVAMPVLIVINAALMTNMTTNNSMLQLLTPDRMRGRVMGVYMMDIGMMPLGGLVVGTIADLTSVQTAMITAACVGLTGVFFVSLFNPRFRRLQV